MNEQETYGPEDIERLLSEKAFDDLYANEKAYVLRHMESKEEYNRMRALMMNLQTNSSIEPDFDAPSSMRDELLQAHEEAHRRPGFVIWLNSLFVPPTSDASFFRVPAFQLAMVAVVAVIGFFVLQPAQMTEDLAVAQEKVVKAAPEKSQENVAAKPKLEAEEQADNASADVSPIERSFTFQVEEEEVEKEVAYKDKTNNGLADVTEDIPDVTTTWQTEEVSPPPATSGYTSTYAAADVSDDTGMGSIEAVGVDSGDLLETVNAEADQDALGNANGDVVVAEQEPMFSEVEELSAEEVVVTASSAEKKSKSAGFKMNRSDKKASEVAEPTMATADMLDYLYTCY